MHLVRTGIEEGKEKKTRGGCTYHELGRPFLCLREGRERWLGPRETGKRKAGRT